MTPKNRTLLIIGAVIALIVIAAGIAVVATGGDDAESSTGSTTVSTSDPSADVEQNRPVDPTGDPLAPYDSAVGDAAIGVAAPVLDGQSFDGSPLTIGGPSDGPTMLVFLAHWCPHCNDEVPELIELNDSGRLPGDLDVVGISTAVAADRPNYPPSEWIVEKGWPWPTMADDAELTAFGYFGGTTFPFLVVLDADGNVLGRQSGESSADEIEAWLDGVLGSAAA